MVNGASATEASLKDGDVIKIGSTEMVFVVEAIPLAPVAPVPSVSPMVPLPFEPPPQNQMPPHGYQGSPHPQSRQRPRSTPPRAANSVNRMRFYGVIAVVVLALVWLMNSTPPKKKKEDAIRTVEEIEKDIKALEEAAGKISEAQTFKSEEEKTRYEEAQKHYLEGFRDYQKGQWVRAMRSFETARAIDPNHKLALRYYNLAQKERDEMIAMLMLEGRRYKEKSMYPRCSAALEKVLDAIPNKDDLKYKQAEALKKECDLLIEKRFR
jgi:tetratricopeptide (TPR) repeat protein